MPPVHLIMLQPDGASPAVVMLLHKGGKPVSKTLPDRALAHKQLFACGGWQGR